MHAPIRMTRLRRSTTGPATSSTSCCCDLVRTEGRPTLLELRVAAEAIFAARADDARALGRTERTWPCAVVAHEHWRVDFGAARTGSFVDITLEEAVVAVNSWSTRSRKPRRSSRFSGCWPTLSIVELKLGTDCRKSGADIAVCGPCVARRSRADR